MLDNMFNSCVFVFLFFSFFFQCKGKIYPGVKLCVVFFGFWPSVDSFLPPVNGYSSTNSDRKSGLFICKWSNKIK